MVLRVIAKSYNGTMDGEGVIIRKANFGDISQIMEIKKRSDLVTFQRRVELSDEGKGCYLVIEDPTSLSLRAKRRQGRGTGEIWGNVLLRFLGTERDPDFPNVEDLFIREDKRGFGLGTKLLEECEKKAREKEFKRIGLSVNPNLNPRALKLYQSLGYRVIEGREKHLSGVYGGVEDWCVDMVKDL